MKTTNHEISSYPIPNYIQLYFKLLTSVFPGIAKKQALKIFFRPLNFKIPEREKAFRSKYRIESFNEMHKEIVVFRVPSSGPKLLFVHGWSGRGSQFHALMLYLNQKGFDCYSFDAPGHGENPKQVVDMPTFAQSAMMLQESFGPFYAGIGHSLGGMALHYASYLGLHITALVQICSPADIEGVVGDFCNTIGGGNRLKAQLMQHLEKKYNVDLNSISPLSLCEIHRLPGLIIHDHNDGDVPIDHALRLLPVWKEAKSHFTVNLGHRRVLRDEETFDVIYQFIDQSNLSNHFTT